MSRLGIHRQGALLALCLGLRVPAVTLAQGEGEEEDEAPDQDDTFPGLRFNWEYVNQ